MSKSSFEQEVSNKISMIPSTMRAAVYRGVNDVRVETIPIPEIGPGEVLVKIHTCGICGTDLKKDPHWLTLRPAHLRARDVRHDRKDGRGCQRLRRWRPRDGLPPYPLRRVLLLPQTYLRAM